LRLNEEDSFKTKIGSAVLNRWCAFATMSQVI